jgi:hypothetical protein
VSTHLDHKGLLSIRIVMRVLFLVLAVTAELLGDWEAVKRVPPETKIQVLTREPGSLRGAFVSASETMLLMRSESGEQSIMRDDIRLVKVAEPARRLRNGILASAIGAGIGLAIGVAICPHCANEGAGGKYAVPLTAVGAISGAAGGLLPLPYRTVYKSK